jgi:beta-glucuronidase
MLKPQSNAFRQLLQLPVFWDFRFDPENAGKMEGWSNELGHTVPIAVPASWNDQFAEDRDNLGPAWYQTSFDMPRGWEQQSVFLWFGSVNYQAEVWINGIELGEHEGGHLPFEFEITDHLKGEGNRLVVRVDGNLAPDRVPPGKIPSTPDSELAIQSFPEANFDFYPFCGIHRPVILCARPKNSVEDITVVTSIEGSTGVVRVDLSTISSIKGTRARVTLIGYGSRSTIEFPIEEIHETLLTVPQARLWCPEDPALYQLVVELVVEDVVIDRYSLDIGIRTIQVERDQLLLNGKPIMLKGFGRHEDFPITGRGLLPAVIIKDYELMRWVGANSFRTTHYPYSDEMMDLADRLGFLVIDETPAVGLFFDQDGLEKRLTLCKQFTQELINRDKNHACVILWNLANEPHSHEPEASQFFRALYDLAKSMDKTRPVTVVSSVGASEAAFEYLDLVCLNRYYGWYSDMGKIAQGAALLSEELDHLHTIYPKPVILTEFGADAIPGVHAQPPEMFSEEYQAELIEQVINVLNSKPYVVGQHVWNLCDFKTGQAVRRMGGVNYKGVFTRDRRPKLAAHRLKQLWGKKGQ